MKFSFRCGKIRHWALLLVIAAAVPGCAAHRAQSVAPVNSDQSGPVNASQRAAATALLTSDVASLRQRWYLFSAEQLLDALCMHRLGLRYLITSPGPEPITSTITEDAVGSGHPATYGVTPIPAGYRPPEDRYVYSLPGPVRARYVTALEGPARARGTLRLPDGQAGTYPTGGCVAAARRELYGSVRAALADPLVPQAMTRLFGVFLSSYHPYLAALHAWHQCMTAAGWHFATPQAAIESIQTLALRGVSRAELARRQAAVASADVTCNARTGLRTRTSEARTTFVAQQPRQLLQELQGIYVTRQRAMRMALKVLS